MSTEFRAAHSWAPQLSTADLQPADILLKRGASLVSRLIIASDGGSYSHAALWSGTGIIEATKDGAVHEGPAAGSWGVYRYMAEAGRRPGLPSNIQTNIISNARIHIGQKYALGELYLLALAFTRVRRPSRALASAVCASLGGPTATRLNEYLQSRYAAAGPRICTELVALSYFSADSSDERAYALRVPPPAEFDLPTDLSERGARFDPEDKTTWAASAHMPPDAVGRLCDSALDPALSAACNGEMPEIDAITFQAAVRSVLLRLSPAVTTADLDLPTANAAKTLYGDIAIVAGSETLVGTVTPRDIEHAANLQPLGYWDARS